MLKMKKTEKKQKTPSKTLDNAGMSLVEVVISMTILSVVVVAVLQSLTMSMVYNGRARKRQDTTFKAEAVMEVFKGYNVGELYEMFTVSDDPDPDPVAEALRAKREASFNGLKNSIGTGTYTVSGDDPKTNPNADLTFNINDVEIKSVDGGTGEKYNIQVVAKPTHDYVYVTPKYDAAKDALFESMEKYDAEARKNAFNAFTADDANIAAFLDDLQNRPENWNDTKDSTLVCDSNGSDLDVDAVKASLKEENIALRERTTTFTVDDTGVTVKMVYKYDIKGYLYHRKEYPEESTDTYNDPPSAPGPTPTPPPATPPLAIAGEIKYANYTPPDDEYEVTLDGAHPAGDDNAVTLGPASPEKLYIYYYPQYAKWNDIDEDGNVASSTPIKDSIEIDNRTAATLKCYLFKQKQGTMSEIKAGVLDGAYSPNVGLVSGSADVELYHNLNDNIGEKPKTGEGSSKSVSSAAAIPGVGGFANKVRLHDGSEVTAFGGEGYMSVDGKADSPLAYQLTLTVSKRNADGTSGQMISEITSSSNER